MIEPFLQATDLQRDFFLGSEVIHAVNGVNLTLQHKDFVSIMGKSGSGKTTLLHLLGGLDQPTAGTVELQGKTISSMKENELAHVRREQFGFVFQFFNLITELTLWENVLLPSAISKRAADHQAILRLFEMLELKHRIHHRPSECSGGEQQRAAVARALSMNPQVLFLDEPTGNLDEASGHQVMRLLSHLVGEFDQTVVMVTHDSDTAEYANRHFHMIDGCISELDSMVMKI